MINASRLLKRVLPVVLSVLKLDYFAHFSQVFMRVLLILILFYSHPIGQCITFLSNDACALLIITAFFIFQQHRNSLYKKLCLTNKPEDIEKWILERKK